MAILPMNIMTHSTLQSQGYTPNLQGYLQKTPISSIAITSNIHSPSKAEEWIFETCINSFNT